MKDQCPICGADFDNSEDGPDGILKVYDCGTTSNGGDLSQGSRCHEREFTAGDGTNIWKIPFAACFYGVELCVALWLASLVLDTHPILGIVVSFVFIALISYSGFLLDRWTKK